MELVVVSLEEWNEVWRRNQHLLAGLMGRDPGLRVLFVEPAQDPLYTAVGGGVPRSGRGLRPGPDLPGVAPGALTLYEPTKLIPRRLDPQQDRRWAASVRRAAERVGFSTPTLWVNDPMGAELHTLTGWPTLYDITDDWLAADRDGATHQRLVRHEGTLMGGAAEVVVCSPALVRTKSARRPVTLLQNAVDVNACRAPAARPDDLPDGPVAVYLGTLHSDRLDVGLCVETARGIAGAGTLVLVGPNALTREEDASLSRAGVLRLGSKDRRDVSGYLQHADVLLVPHVVDDFTESLDPIKLYEYRAVGRPVVSTPVSGFRESGAARFRVATAEYFPSAVRAVLPARDRFPHGADGDVPSWADRVTEMEAVLARVSPATTRTARGAVTDVVPAHVRVRLGHAAVQWLADFHGIDVLHIKGHALDPSLVHPGRRPSDVDVLVRPGQVEALVDACHGAGFRTIGRFATSSPFEHSTTLVHDEFGHVDVHRHYPGIGLAPEAAFDRLWRDRRGLRIAGRWCPTPGLHAQVVVLVLHAARNIRGGRSTRDVVHTWRRADPDTRREVRRVAAELDAEVAFAAGVDELHTLPASPDRDLWEAVSHPDRRLDEWRARITAAPDLRSKVRLVARMPLVSRDHLAVRLGRRPTPADVAGAFVGRCARGLREVTDRGGTR